MNYNMDSHNSLGLQNPAYAPKYPREFYLILLRVVQEVTGYGTDTRRRPHQKLESHFQLHTPSVGLWGIPDSGRIRPDRAQTARYWGKPHYVSKNQRDSLAAFHIR